MQSMTGFGAGVSQLGGGRITMEIRALNHKHQDVRLRLPSELADHGSFLEQAARSHLGRGRYDISVRSEGQLSGQATFDETRLAHLFASLARVHARLTPEAPLRLDPLLSLPEVLSSTGLDAEEARAALLQAFEQATGTLTAMRTTEGAALKRELTTRLDILSDLIEKVCIGSVDLVEHHRARLEARIGQLIGDPKMLNIERLEQEIALLADRSDIVEELVRLGSHCQQFDQLLKDDDPVGRRLDFLLQEMSREVNTIGSKCQHAPVAHLVVEMKSEVERLREQVQNVA